ncbi:MAG: efflux RND transporter periplasmic adaptor subunit [Acutalibacteraceae bacterium]|jgi:multidrug efflux pump subunit AcrA (membrane-fusion protein)
MKEKFLKLLKNKTFIVIVVIAVASTGIACYFKFSDKGTPVSLAKVDKGSVEQFFETNAVIESGSQSNFQILEGTKVTTVNVGLGDDVKQGDVLATFDTSSLNAILSEKKQAYDSATKRYNNSISQSQNTQSQLKDIRQQIASIDAQIAVLKSNPPASNSQGTTAPAPITPDQLRSILNASNEAGQTNFSDEEIDRIVSSLGSVGSSDLQNTLSSISSADAQISALQAQKALLETQKNMIENQDYSSLQSTYKSLMDSAKNSYDETKNIVNSLKNGWVAQCDGIVTQINITAGEVFKPVQSKSSANADMFSAIGNALSNDFSQEDLSKMISGATSTQETNIGMVVDNYGDYFASFSLGKYDALNVKLNQEAFITSVAGEYEGYVSYINPVATGSGSAISSITGSDSNKASLQAKAKIKNPNDALIIGFDVKLLIKTNEVKNILIIPIEAVQVDSGKQYVYIYNKSTQTVSKKNVDLGISSNTAYEVKSGLKQGDLIIKNPPKDLENGVKVYDKGAIK